jgi:hypothetical protein
MSEEPASPMTEWRSQAEGLPTAARWCLSLLLPFQEVPEATDITLCGYIEHDTSAYNTFSLTVIRDLSFLSDNSTVKINPVLLYYHEKTFKEKCYGWWYIVLEIGYS